MNTEKKYIDNIAIGEIINSHYDSTKYSLKIFKKKKQLFLSNGSFAEYLDRVNKSNLFLLPILRFAELKNNDRDSLEKLLWDKGQIYAYTYYNLDKCNFENHLINKLYFHQNVRHLFRLSLPWQFFKQLKKLFKICDDSHIGERLIFAKSLKNNLSIKLKTQTSKNGGLESADWFVCKKKNWIGEIDLSLLLDNRSEVFINHLTPDDYDAYRYTFVYEDNAGVYYVNVVKLVSINTNVQHITTSVDFKSIRKKYFNLGDTKNRCWRLSRGKRIFKEEQDSIQDDNHANYPARYTNSI